jgi:hypothetical protein
MLEDEGENPLQFWSYKGNSCHVDTWLFGLACVQMGSSQPEKGTFCKITEEYLGVASAHMKTDRNARRDELRSVLKETELIQEV